MLAAHAREEQRMRRVLATLVALSLLMSMFTGIFAPVPEARAAGPAPVVLGTAGNFVILAETAITTTGATSITGDIGISPNGASSITGFGLTMDSSNTFSTSSLVTGKVYAADYYPPTPINMGIAVGDMYTAYTNARGVINPTQTELGAGDISGMTLAPGVYKWSTGVLINSNVTLSGGANDVWIFQIAGDLKIASAGDVTSGIKVVLKGGAQASHVFWQVQGSNFGATLGTYSTFNGNILSAKQIIMQTGAVLNGRALAQTQVTLDHNTVGPGPAKLSGTITVIKNTVGGNDTFHFTVSDDVYNVVSTFDIPTTTVGQGTVGQGIYYVPVTAGTYYVTEGALPAGWVSNDPSMVQTATVDDGTVAAAVYFNNNAMGTLEVIKHTTGGNGTFHFTVSGGVYDVSPFDITTDGGIGSYTVPVIAGSYTVTEGTLPAGWVATGDTAMDVIVPINGTGTATFANHWGKLEIIKNTVGGDGTFHFTVSGGVYDVPAFDITTIAGQGSYSVPVTTGVPYIVTEVNLPAGWVSDGLYQTVTVSTDDGTGTATFTNNITPTPPVVTPPVVTPPVVTPPVVTPPVVTPPVVTPPVVTPPVVTPAPTTVYHQTFFIGYPDGTFKPDRNVSSCL